MITIHLDDIFTWLGQVPTTVGTIRTQMKKAHDAHRLLRRQALANTIEARHQPFLNLLNAMLGERILQGGGVGDECLCGDEPDGVYEAVIIKITPFMNQVNDVLRISLETF